MLRALVGATLLSLSACAPEPGPVVPAPSPSAPAPLEQLDAAESADEAVPDADVRVALPEPNATATGAERPTNWPADVPFVSGARVTSAQSDAPVIRLEVEKNGRSGAQIFAELVASARAEGLSVGNEYVDERTVSLARDGKRAWLELEEGWSRSAHVTVHRAGQAPRKLGGACVAIPNKRFEYQVDASGIDQQGEYRRASRTWDMRTAHLADVDDDGEPDAFVPVSTGACPWDVGYAVYVVRGKCGHKVGEVGPGLLAARSHEEPPDPSGFRALAFDSDWAKAGPGGIPVSVRRSVEHVFSNGAYRKVKDETKRGKCHHCAVTHCRRTAP